jgi:hypothetical protein
MVAVENTAGVTDSAISLVKGMGHRVQHADALKHRWIVAKWVLGPGCAREAQRHTNEDY